MDVYATAVQQILNWEPRITICSDQSTEQILRNIYQTEPRIIYFIKTYSVSRYYRYCTFTFSYRNQEFPLNQVYLPKPNEIPWLVRHCIAENKLQCVLCVSDHTSVSETLHRYQEQLAAVYPNLMSFSIAFERHSCSLYGICVIHFRYRIGTVMLKKMEQELSREVSRVAAMLFRPDMPEIVKCYIAHNYLTSTVRYWNEDKGNPLERSYLQSAYGALIKKQCVCHGYAEAYKRLLNETGIGCDIVLGQTNHARDTWHAWNLVHLRGGELRFHTDVTWDAGSGRAEKKYFCRGDGFMAGDHSWDRSRYAPCTKDPELIALATQAAIYCMQNRRKLLAAGLRIEWIS